MATDFNLDPQAQRALARVASHRASFQSQKVTFIAPTSLDFTVDGNCVGVQVHDAPSTMREGPAQASLDALTSDTPKLAFTPTTKPVRAYLEALSQLLAHLDAVDSGGNPVVREHRGTAIREVDAEARWVEKWVMQVWVAHVRRSAEVTAARERTEAALASIVAIEIAFNELKSAFVLPEELSFVANDANVGVDARPVPLPPLDSLQESSEEHIPRLSFTSSNASLHKLKEGTLGLLVRLDDVSTGGNPLAKERRTTLVNSIEATAQQADHWTRAVWLFHLQGQASPHENATPSSAEHTQQIFYSLGALDGRFRQLKASFSAPSSLDFIVHGASVGVDCSAVPLPVSGTDEVGKTSIAEAPPLGYTPANIGFRRYNEDVDRILSEIDALPSAGESSIRERRAALVKAVQSEVSRLEAWVNKAWTSRRGESPTAPAPRAEDVRSLLLSLEELFSGVTKTVRYSRHLSDGTTIDQAVEIKVLPGYKAGTKIRFPRAGNERSEGQPDDLVFIVEESPHARFIREGSNLITQLPLSGHPQKSFVGHCSLETLDGRPLAISSPLFSAQSVSATVIPEEGMPIRRDGSPKGRGDLIVQWKMRDIPPPVPPKPAFQFVQPPFTANQPPHSSFFGSHDSGYHGSQQMHVPFPASLHSQHLPHAPPYIPYVNAQTNASAAYPLYAFPSFPVPATNAASPARIVRKGFWNSRGDHLTRDGFVVHAPVQAAYPPDLQNYPLPARGYADYKSDFYWYSPNQRIHPDTLSWDNQPPRRTYDSFIQWIQVPTVPQSA